MVTDSGLKQMASSFKDKVQAVRLNEQVVLTDFIIDEITAALCTVEFDVPNDISLLSRMELIGADNLVLTDNTLYVPIENDTRFRYTLRFDNAR